MNDAINPAHYGGTRGEEIPVRRDPPINLIEITEQCPLLEGNVIKYVFRWRQKGGVEDLYKARWFLDRLIRRAEAEAGMGHAPRDPSSQQ